MGRADEIEMVDGKVLVKNLGEYVMYDASLSDMEDLEGEMIRIGSLFLTRFELMRGENHVVGPSLDRMTVV